MYVPTYITEFRSHGKFAAFRILIEETKAAKAHVCSSFGESQPLTDLFVIVVLIVQYILHTQMQEPIKSQPSGRTTTGNTAILF